MRLSFCMQEWAYEVFISVWSSDVCSSDLNWTLILAMSTVFFIGSWLQQAGLATTTATNGGFLTGLYVFCVPVLCFLLFRTRPHPLIFVCVPLALRSTGSRVGKAFVITCIFR